MATEKEHTPLETQLLGQVSASDAKAATMQKQLDALTAQQNALDPDDATHQDLVTKVNEMSTQLSTVERENAETKTQLETEQAARKAAETKASEATAKVDANAKEAADTQVTEQGTQTVDGWMSDFDKQYGAEHHNAALAAAQAEWATNDASKKDADGEFIATEESRATIIKSLLEEQYIKLRDAKVANDNKGTEEPSLSAPSAAGNLEAKQESWQDIPDEKFQSPRDAKAALQQQFKREEAGAT